MNVPVALIILDGWGYSNATRYNAIYQAHPETFNYLWNHFPHALLKASGEAVGLPPHTVGNSEVGHLTIGAGQIIEQSLTRINTMIKDTSFYTNQMLTQKLRELKQTNGRLHLIGLVSDGSVHSSLTHLHALIKKAQQENITEIFIHAFLDGRDTPPRSASKYLKQLPTITSLSGRYYAMDRDENWDRTLQVYNMLCDNKKNTPKQWKLILNDAYQKNITDEFITPTLCDPNGTIQNGDGIISFNFRPDRMRQLTSLLLNQRLTAHTHKPIPPIKTKAQPLWFISMTHYDKAFNNPVILKKEPVKKTFFDQLEAAGKTIFTIAETEKYAHVTYFFNGGKEIKRSNETRVLIPSQQQKSYANNPEMSAQKITDSVISSLKNNASDFYLINYANPDMVGHSGDFTATKKAIQCIDNQLKQLYHEFVIQRNGTLFITSDHGNAEYMYDEKKQTPVTGHTNNLVPFIHCSQNLINKKTSLSLQKISEIASYIFQWYDYLEKHKNPF